MERAGSDGIAVGIDAIGLEPPDPVDTLLEAHAAIVAEIRVRAAQPDLDGRDLVVLAKTLTALESAIEIVADDPVGSIRGCGLGMGT
ncbi:MAG: hypothetical protein AAGU73_06330 [Actinomycetota bacterium]